MSVYLKHVPVAPFLFGFMLVRPSLYFFGFDSNIKLAGVLGEATTSFLWCRYPRSSKGLVGIVPFSDTRELLSCFQFF